MYFLQHYLHLDGKMQCTSFYKTFYPCMARNIQLCCRLIYICMARRGLITFVWQDKDYLPQYGKTRIIYICVARQGLFLCGKTRIIYINMARQRLYTFCGKTRILYICMARYGLFTFVWQDKDYLQLYFKTRIIYNCMSRQGLFTFVW